jgi:hypothetical protein
MEAGRAASQESKIDFSRQFDEIYKGEKLTYKMFNMRIL